MSLLEAKKVIDLPGVDEATTHPSDLGRLIHERYELLNGSNSPDNGGSVYLQAKILSARQVIEDDFVQKYGQTLLPPPPSAAELAAAAAAQNAEDAAAAERKAWEDRERAHQLRVKRNKQRQAMQNEEILNKKRSQGQ